MEKEPTKPPPPREPARDAPERDDVRVAASPVRCPFCREDVVTEGTDWVACKGCLARHHVACWGEARRCATCGGATCLGEAVELGPVEVRSTPLDIRTERPWARRAWTVLSALFAATLVLFVVLWLRGELPGELLLMLLPAGAVWFAFGLGAFELPTRVQTVRVERQREG